MTDRNPMHGNGVHELKLGRSFDPNARVAFHSIRYDFKPASMDTGQEAQFEVGEGNQVSVMVPHVQGSGATHTVYKGNKKPCPKECVLVIDRDTGTITLEKLTNTVQLKKTRMEGSSKTQQSGRPLTPVEFTKQKANSPSKPKSSQRSPSSLKDLSPVSSSQADPEVVSTIGEISDSSSDSSSSSDSDSDMDEDRAPSLPNGVAPSMPVLDSAPSYKPIDFLSEDLQLSESGSDSD